MPRRDRVLFDSVAGSLLKELGYEVEPETRSIGTLERLYWRGHDRLGRARRRLSRPVRLNVIRTAWEYGVAAVRRRIATTPDGRLRS
jgi:hypothetical protein